MYAAVAKWLCVEKCVGDVSFPIAYAVLVIIFYQPSKAKLV